MGSFSNWSLRTRVLAATLVMSTIGVSPVTRTVSVSCPTLRAIATAVVFSVSTRLSVNSAVSKPISCALMV